MKQLENAADIHQLVSVFYDKVLKDEILAPFFSRLDFSAHLPQMEMHAQAQALFAPELPIIFLTTPVFQT